MHDLDVLDDDEQEQRFPPGEQVEAHRPHDHHDVEVDAAQVGAEPAPPVEAVGVGDVGVEGGPGQVQAAAHPPGLGAAVATAGGVPHLVEGGRQHKGREHEQEDGRLVEGLAGRLGHAVLEEQPVVGEHQADEGGEDQRREEEGPERRAESAGDALGDHRVAELQGEEGIELLDLGVRAVGARHQPQGPELGVDQGAHVVGGDGTPDLPADVLGDLRQRVVSVGLLGHRVQERRELDDLPVTPAGDRRGRPEAGAFELPDQLGAVGEAGRARAVSRSGGHRSACRRGAG